MTTTEAAGHPSQHPPGSKAWAEMRLWQALSAPPATAVFRRRVMLGAFRADLVCEAAALVIDLDGDSPTDLAAQAGVAAFRERRRQGFAALGFRVLCLSPQQVDADWPSVWQQIQQQLQLRAPALITASPECADDPQDAVYMRRALALAERAAAAGEVPVGALLVAEGRIIGEGWNRSIQACDPSAHAEIEALRAAGSAMGNYRLSGASLYVTLEPCVMCAGALLHARVSRLVFGAWDAKAGAVRSVYDLIAQSRLNHRVDWRGGVLEAECGERLRQFFRERRER